MSRAFSPMALMRSTPVRQALLLIAVFAAVDIATVGGAYFKVRADLLATLESDLEREVAGFDLSATPAALSAIVAAKARATDPRDTVIVFLGADGTQTGNAVAIVDGDTVRLVARDDGAETSATGYLHEVRRLSGGVLLVAISLAPAEQLRNSFLSLIGLSLIPTVLIALVLAGLIARHTARRVAAIEKALAAMSSGDLSVRLAVEPARDDDLARIARGVNQMAARQQSATEALRQVSSDLAHELRMPLQRIAVAVHDLRRHIADGTDTAELADQAIRESEHINAVFRALLQIAQIEGKGGKSERAQIDLRSVADQIFELYQPVVEDAGRTLLRDLPPHEVPVEADADLLTQALANLVENAIRHTPAGSRITISVASDPESTQLTVADNGPGIPEAERGKVIQRLYRMERSGGTPGYGLGLSLVAAVAKLHGARLALEDNRPGLRASLVFPAG